MNTKHTEGPWRKGTPGPNGCYTIGTQGGLMVAMIAHSIHVPNQKQQAEANAALIAAAPELLTLVKKWLRLHYDTGTATLDGLDITAETEELIARTGNGGAE